MSLRCSSGERVNQAEMRIQNHRLILCPAAAAFRDVPLGIAGDGLTRVFVSVRPQARFVYIAFVAPRAESAVWRKHSQPDSSSVGSARLRRSRRAGEKLLSINRWKCFAAWVSEPRDEVLLQTAHRDATRAHGAPCTSLQVSPCSSARRSSSPVPRRNRRRAGVRTETRFRCLRR